MKVLHLSLFVFTSIALAQNTNPCAAKAEFRQFDFWLGSWDVQVQGKTIAASRIEQVLDGCLIQENWMPFKGQEGKSWNFFDMATKHWTQVWMSAGSALHLEGALRDGSMVLEGKQAVGDGKTALDRITWTPLDGGRVRQHWVRTTDDGKTWSTQFDGVYVPKKN